MAAGTTTSGVCRRLAPARNTPGTASASSKPSSVATRLPTPARGSSCCRRPPLGFSASRRRPAGAFGASNATSPNNPSDRLGYLLMAQSNGARKVLIVDGDSATRRDVRSACAQDGYQVLEADSGEEALPDASGFDVCRELRKKDTAVPVIMMSSRSDEIDAVVALEIGADDYVVKPLRLRELAARIAAHLRRMRLESAEATRNRLEFRDLLIDVNERRIYRAGQEVELTHTEFDLLTFLASNAGKVLSREKILNSIWGYEYPIETRVIDVHIRNLRRKIESQPSRPYYILAVPGIGYRFTNARPA